MVDPLPSPEFGTSGLRGLADALTDDLVAAYVAAFARISEHDGTLVMGRDLRSSSPRIADSVARGAATAGLKVLDCGVVPTPALAMAALARPTIAVMVTGSHIPADRNGLKFYSARGEITKADEAALVAEVAKNVSVRAKTPEIEPLDAFGAYVARYVDAFGPRALQGMKIGLWEQSSAAREVLRAILEGLGGEVIGLEPLERFEAVDTEAVGGALREKLEGWVATHSLDAIVSTDGDGDRPLLADAGGKVVPGDILGPITARVLTADTIVTPISANTLVDLMGDFAIHKTRIGSPYVIAGMETVGTDAKVLGYEPNGGVLLGFETANGLSPLMTRDSALPIVAVLSAAKGGSVAGLVEALPARRTATDRLQDVPRAASDVLVARLIAGDLSVLPDGLGELAGVDTTDGARMTFESGVIVTLRPSGNAPELRVYVEAGSDAEARALLAEALERVRSAIS